jgi:methyl-accepting chemotaxis protein
VLIKKKGLLNQILNLTLNQETVLLCSAGSPADKNDTGEENSVMFRDMNDEKQKLIEQVINSDNLFQNIFDSASDDFGKNAEKYKAQIKKLQELIREVMDIDVKIRVQEQKNKDLITSGQPRPKIKTIKVSKDNLLKRYENNNRPKN